MNHNSRLTVSHKFLVLMAVVATFFLRPFAFGAEYPILGLACVIISALILTITLPHDNKGFSRIVLIIFSFYLLDTILIYATGAGGETAFTKFAYVIIGAMLFSNKTVMYTYFKYFKSVVLLLIIFAIIGFIMESFLPSAKLSIKELSLGPYEFILSKPFILTGTGSWEIESAAINFLIGFHRRNFFFFIEPGMVPPFFTALIFMIYESPFEKHKARQIALLITGILLSFSTGGPLILLACAGSYYILKSIQRNTLSLKKIIVASIMVIVAVGVFFYMPNFGLRAKMEMSNAQAESIATHMSVTLYVIIGSVSVFLCSLVCSMKKVNYPLYLTIAIGLLIGYLSNYIAFTFIFTLFLMWGENGKRKLYRNEVIIRNQIVNQTI